MIANKKLNILSCYFLILTTFVIFETKAAIKPLYEININKTNKFSGTRHEKGFLKNAGTDNEELSVQGSYTVDYPSTKYESGNYQLRTEYVADEKGFRAKYNFTIISFDDRLDIKTLKSAAG